MKQMTCREDLVSELKASYEKKFPKELELALETNVFWGVSAPNLFNAVEIGSSGNEFSIPGLCLSFEEAEAELLSHEKEQQLLIEEGEKDEDDLDEFEIVRIEWSGHLEDDVKVFMGKEKALLCQCPIFEISSF